LQYKLEIKGEKMVRMMNGFILTSALLAISCGDKEDSIKSSGEENPAEIAAGSQPVDGASGQWRRTNPADVTAPSAPEDFYVGTGVGLGSILVTINYPEIVGDYNKIDIRRLLGGTPPADCKSGVLAKSLTSFATTQVVDDSLYPGDEYSYIACVYDAAGNETKVSAPSSAITNTSQRIFVTSDATFDGNFKADFQGDTFSEGYLGADARCQYLADTAKIGGIWEALIGAPPYRHPLYTTKFYGLTVNRGVSSKVVATTKNAFWSTVHQNKIVLDENGDIAEPVLDADESTVLSGYVWGGMSNYGTNVGNSCSDWSDNSSSYSGYVGDNRELASWAYAYSTNCDFKARLYCMETADQSAVAKPTLSIAAGSSDGTIDVTIAFPADTSKISSVNIVRHYGKTNSDVTCRNNTYHTVGDFVKSYDGSVSYPFTGETFADNTSETGGWFNYSACVYDLFGNLSHQIKTAGLQSGAVSTYRRAFATAATYDGNLTGVAGANTKCQAAADGATAGALGGTWKALIGSSAGDIFTNTAFSSDSATTTTTSSGAATYDFNGNLVAVSNSNLSYGYIPLYQDVISTDENGITLAEGSKFWTGSISNGGIATSNNCSDWTDNTTSFNGYFGEKGNYWDAAWFSRSNMTCDQVAHLYCIEQ
jgi:hypothetical protein